MCDLHGSASTYPVPMTLYSLNVLLGRIAVIRSCGVLLHRRSSMSVGRSVCRSVTIVSRAKTAEPIETPFGVWTLVGPRRSRSRSTKSKIPLRWLVRSWFEAGSELVRSWFEPGSKLVRSWFGAGLKLVRSWFKAGLKLVRSWLNQIA